MASDSHPTPLRLAAAALCVVGVLFAACDNKSGAEDRAPAGSHEKGSAPDAKESQPLAQSAPDPEVASLSPAQRALLIRDPLEADVSHLDGPVVEKIMAAREGVKSDPTNPGRWIFLAHTYAGNRVPSPAISAYERALELDPNNAKLLYQLALAQHENAQTDGALATINQVLALDDSVPAYHWRRANWLFDEGRIEEAGKEYQAALRLDPQDAAAVAGMARVQLEADHLEDAITSLKQVLVVAGEAPFGNYIRRLLATAYRRVGEEEKAGALEVLGTDGPPIWNDPAKLEVTRFMVRGIFHRAALASSLANQGRYEEAITELRAFLEVKPEETAARNQLARFLDFAGHKEEAAAEYRRTLDLSPDNREALVQLGKLLGQGGRQQEGLALLDRAIAIEPLYAQAHFFRGSVLRRMGRIQEAAASYRRAVELDETHPKSWVAVGLLEVTLERWDTALQAFKRAQVLGQDRGDMWIGMAQCLIALDQLDEAQTALDKGRGKKPFDQKKWMNVSLELKHARAEQSVPTPLQVEDKDQQPGAGR